MKDSIFQLCVSFLERLAHCTELSYKQMSVIFNIYLQGGILMLSAFLPLAAVLLSASRLGKTPFIVFLLLAALYGILHVQLFRFLLHRYGRPLEPSFDRCVHDLQHICRKAHLSYNALNILIFICAWSIMLAVHALPLFMVQDGKGNSSISMPDASIASHAPSEECLVERTDTCGLIILYPKFNTVDLVCGTMPSPQDKHVLLCAEACFTGTLSHTFSHRNVAGDHISGGQYHKGFRCKRNTGAFIYADGKCTFLYSNYARQMKSAARPGSAAFAQEMIIHRGKAVSTTRKDTNRNQFRALCQVHGSLCIAESKTVIPFGNFKHALLSAGATEALYLDMGPGWNHAWYRPNSHTVTILHPKTHSYCTNWITFYR